MKKIRVNFMMPEHLHEYVKELAENLGIPTSTMYIMIVNLYKDNSTDSPTIMSEGLKKNKLNYKK